MIKIFRSMFVKVRFYHTSYIDGNVIFIHFMSEIIKVWFIKSRALCFVYCIIWTSSSTYSFMTNLEWSLGTTFQIGLMCVHFFLLTIAPECIFLTTSSCWLGALLCYGLQCAPYQRSYYRSSSDINPCIKNQYYPSCSKESPLLLRP